MPSEPPSKSMLHMLNVLCMLGQHSAKPPCTSYLAAMVTLNFNKQIDNAIIKTANFTL